MSINSDTVFELGENSGYSRSDAGYGSISPKNRYVGGQEPYCRLNNLIFTTVRDGADLFLWFFETLDYN